MRATVVLPVPGLPEKDHVEGELLCGQAVFLPQLVDLHHVDKIFHFLLDVCKANVTLQLCHQIFYLFRGRRGIFRALRGGGSGFGNFRLG